MTWLKHSKPMHSMPLSMPLSWTESLDHLEHVMGPCWCFWAGPHQNDLSKNNCLRGVILILFVRESIFVGWGFPFSNSAGA